MFHVEQFAIDKLKECELFAPDKTVLNKYRLNVKTKIRKNADFISDRHLNIENVPRGTKLSMLRSEAPRSALP